MKKRELTISEMIRDAAIMYDVENGLGNHCYMHAAGYYLEQTQQNNSLRDDHTVSHSFGGFVGAKSAWDNWNGNLQHMAEVKYEEIRKIYPRVEGFKGYQVNALLEAAIHTQATSIVEIAGDGQTVRISMYTPGLIFSVLNTDQKKRGTWLWERYGIEYLHEEGKWREWHTMVCPDFFGPLDGCNWGRQAYDMEMAIRSGKVERRKMAPPAEPDIPGPCHREYSVNAPLYDTVPWPEPYEHWEDTDHYIAKTLPPL